MTGTPVPKPAVDEIDRKIIRALQSDGRASHRDLAKATGLGLATVNRRIRAMEEAKIIRGYHVDIDAAAAGYSLTVVVGLRIEKGHLREVQNAISQDRRVVSVFDVTGEWDGIVIARAADRADLDDLAKTTLSAAHIQRTNTMVVLSTVLDGRYPPVRP